MELRLDNLFLINIHLILEILNSKLPPLAQIASGDAHGLPELTSGSLNNLGGVVEHL